MVLGTRRGFKYTPSATEGHGTGGELSVEVDGTERIAMDATGISFNGSAPIAATAITGDISLYAEATLKAILTQLAALGLLTDSTTT